MSGRTFSSTAALLEYSKKFSRIHLERFEKDIRVCATTDSNGRQAYFPALMACLGVLDLFSGLYAGKMDRPNPDLNDLRTYAGEFLPAEYSDLILTLLYVCFRHKVAHLAHPYDVFDTDTATNRKGQKLVTDKRRLVTWDVDFSNNRPAISLSELPSPQLLVDRAPEGWNVLYDHLARIHIKSLYEDIVESVNGADGYLVELSRNISKQQNFEKCINVYFPEP